jgi:ribosomal protein S18 acetylase RimI-like enzyme
MATVRNATVDDVEPLHRLGEEVSEFSVNDRTVTFWPKEILFNALRSKDVVILVAEEEGKVVGFIIANYNEGLRKAIIENVFVAPGNRNAGIGKELLAQLLQVLVERKCEYVSTLIPTDAQSAAELYEDNGFTKGETFLWLDKTISDNFKSL